MDTSKLLAAATFLAGMAIAAQPAHAAPVVQAVSSSYSVGQTVTFLVLDDDIAQGDQGGLYMADLAFSWDTSVLKILTQPLTPSSGLASFISGGGFFSIGAAGYDGAPDATNSGSYLASMAGDMPATSGAFNLFTLSFVALQSTTSALLELSEAQGGAYGASTTPFATNRASVAITGTHNVPEPATWALGALALAATFAARRRSR